MAAEHWCKNGVEKKIKSVILLYLFDSAHSLLVTNQCKYNCAEGFKLKFCPGFKFQTLPPVDRVLSPAYRERTPLEDQLTELLEKLDLSAAMKHSPSRSKRLKLLKKTILEVRSQVGLRKSLPPSSPPPDPSANSSEPKLLTVPTQPEGVPATVSPPLLTPSPAHSPEELHADVSTSVPAAPPGDGHAPVAPLFNGELHPEEDAAATTTCSRRTNNLFRKSKSASPQKPPRSPDDAAPSPPLGAKTFLSVVIPRLETLLLPRKRRRSSAGGDEDGDGDESPVKRLDTGSFLVC